MYCMAFVNMRIVTKAHRGSLTSSHEASLDSGVHIEGQTFEYVVIHRLMKCLSS